jgi:hypothetical protein
MNKKRHIFRIRSAAAAALLLCAGLYAALSAENARADTFGLQLAGGVAERGLHKADLGLVWDPNINWWDNGSWHFSLVGEAHLAYWETSEGTEHHDIDEFGASPMVRFIKDGGAIRPYVEAGAGVRLLSHTTFSDLYTLSTAFQFAETVGVGIQFGSHRQYLTGLRFQHVSNADIKRPNPGANFSEVYLQYNF